MIGGGVNRFAWWFQNQTTPSTTPGTSVTPGISNAEGSWTQIASAANIAFDVWGVHLWISGGNVTAAAKNFLLDLGDDPAGGTSYTAKISNLICGQSSNFINGGQQYYFPLRIAAGSTVAVRIQGSHGTATNSRVFATFYGKPTRPEFLRTSRYCETIGTITNSNGVSFNLGGTGSEGAWNSLGTTTKELWWWQLGQGFNITATSNVAYMFDLAYGDATNKHLIFENWSSFGPGTAEQHTVPLQIQNAYCEVPAGATIYARGSCSAADPTGNHCLAYGMGG